MYSGSSSRFGSLVMPLRLSVANLVLVDHPIQGAAVAQAVAEDLGRDARPASATR